MRERGSIQAVMSSRKKAAPRPLPRIAQFERLGYGLFLHWGLYSQLEKGEWILEAEKIPFQKYEQLASTFTAADFDAPAIARLAREGGMRYAVLTTRHHEGFSLYDTRGLSTFDSLHAPAQRDLAAEFAEACRAVDIVPFFYHTTLDWRWNSATCSEKKFKEYLEYLNDSVEILCRHYGKIGGSGLMAIGRARATGTKTASTPPSAVTSRTPLSSTTQASMAGASAGIPKSTASRLSKACLPLPIVVAGPSTSPVKCAKR